LERYENVVGIKDSSGDMTLTMEYIRVTSTQFAVLCGRDTLIYPTLACGGSGAVAATANVVPRLCVELLERHRVGDHRRALEAQLLLTSLRAAFELGTFPVVVKEALAMIGLPIGPTRAPVGGIGESARKQLEEILQRLKPYWSQVGELKAATARPSSGRASSDRGKPGTHGEADGA
jgi:4-hydroxy-tetrahydrodipicolinate synthase